MREIAFIRTNRINILLKAPPPPSLSRRHTQVKLMSHIYKLLGIRTSPKPLVGGVVLKGLVTNPFLG